MTGSLFDHPVLSAWTADAETAEAVSWPAELAGMLAFESTLAAAEARNGVISQGAAEAIARACAGFEPDMDALRGATMKDGVPVPGLVAQLRRAVCDEHGAALHFGATSQDVIDTALMLLLKRLLPLYSGRLSDLLLSLDALELAWGARPLMAYTRMRAALPCTVADRIATWRSGLTGAHDLLDRLRAHDLALQFAGPVGTLEKLGSAAGPVRADLANALGLADPLGSWHTDRGRIRRIAAALVEITTALGKLGLDFGLMAQDGIDAIELAGGASSSMAHKVNPVDAELLVALARYNVSLQSALGQSGLQEYERSGAGWTLEWAVVPQMLQTTGGALVAAARVVASVQRMGRP